MTTQLIFLSDLTPTTIELTTEPESFPSCFPMMTRKFCVRTWLILPRRKNLNIWYIDGLCGKVSDPLLHECFLQCFSFLMLVWVSLAKVVFLVCFVFFSKKNVCSSGWTKAWKVEEVPMVKRFIWKLFSFGDEVRARAWMNGARQTFCGISFSFAKN